MDEIKIIEEKINWIGSLQNEFIENAVFFRNELTELKDRNGSIPPLPREFFAWASKQVLTQIISD